MTGYILCDSVKGGHLWEGVSSGGGMYNTVVGGIHILQWQGRGVKAPVGGWSVDIRRNVSCACGGVSRGWVTVGGYIMRVGY